MSKLNCHDAYLELRRATLTPATKHSLSEQAQLKASEWLKDYEAEQARKRAQQRRTAFLTITLIALLPVWLFVAASN